MSEQRPEQKRQLPSAVIVGIILAVLCGVSWYIRAVLPHDKIFVDGMVWFRETDAYYHMRYIESLVHNFPRTISFDPYVLYQGGGPGIARQPFFDLLTSAIILLVSRGVPALHTMETIAAYMPPILGTLTLIPVYFIGKELFSRWVGIIAAALVVILPGEFLHRSLLGFTDHHVAEVLFSTVCMLFLIMAIKRARQKEISFAHILNRDWSTMKQPLMYTLLGGIFLGIYLLSWWGGLMFVFIIFIYLVIQFIVDHLRRRSTDYLCIVGTPLFLIASLMLLPILAHVGTVDRVSLLFAILAPIALSIISRFMSRRALQPGYYPLVLMGLAGIGLVALRAASPSLLQSMFSLFGIFRLRGGWLTIMEATPLLLPQGTFTFSMVWANFTTSFFIAIIALVMLVFVVVKERSVEKSLFLVWTVIMLLAILAQRRFGYYYTLNAALLTGYFSWKMLDIAGLKRLLVKSKAVATTVKAVRAVKKFKKKEKKAREKTRPGTFMQPRDVWVRVIVVGIVLFFLVLFPNISRASALAQQPIMMNKAWYDACAWLKDNSPEPFDHPDFYYAFYPPKDEFEYPETAYAVMSWWDYGYYIMQIGHRIPNANPGQAGAVEAGKFFTAQNATAVQEIVQQYNLGTKYVMIDSDMATGKFYAMVEWAGKNLSEFYDVYYVPTEQGGQWATLFHPAYYQSMAVRLYNFDGESVDATQPLVISYEERRAAGGEKYKAVTGGQSFATYEEALAYIASQASGNYRIVGTSPWVSPVPLDALSGYQRVYPESILPKPNGATAPQPTVKIFKYIGSD